MESNATYMPLNVGADWAVLESVWLSVKASLDDERRRIAAEIEQYPPPIPRCDAQFNYLLEERASIALEVYRLERLASQQLAPDDRLRLLAEFISSSHHLNDETRHSLRSSLVRP